MKKEMISVVMATCNRYQVALENVTNIFATQTYKNLQVVVCDDSDKINYETHSQNFQNQLKEFGNTKYIYSAAFDVNGNKDYGLARGRNHGVIEADGEFIVLLDDRITPENPDSLSQFGERLKTTTKKIWLFGDKGAHKESFVENFSAIRRCLLIDAGMFCERINRYGGMTRELHGRFTRQGFSFQYVPEALAKQVCKSSGWDTKPKEIEEMRTYLKKMFSR